MCTESPSPLDPSHQCTDWLAKIPHPRRERTRGSLACVVWAARSLAALGSPVIRVFSIVVAILFLTIILGVILILALLSVILLVFMVAMFLLVVGRSRSCASLRGLVDPFAGEKTER